MKISGFRKLFYLLLFSFSISTMFIQCTTDDVIEDTESDLNIKALNIYNFTGHLVRRSGEKCGDAIQVEFVLNSPEDRKEYIIDGDRVLSVSLAAQRGQTIGVSAYEVKGTERIFLTNRSMTFNPPSDENREVIPSIVLCPKDQIEFYDFN